MRLSAGPMRTLAGAGISDARTLLHYPAEARADAPLADARRGWRRRALSPVRSVRAVTGEVHFVDCGYSTIAMPNLGALKTLEQAEELEAAVEKATPREAAQ